MRKAPAFKGVLLKEESDGAGSHKLPKRREQSAQRQGIPEVKVEKGKLHGRNSTSIILNSIWKDTQPVWFLICRTVSYNLTRRSKRYYLFLGNSKGQTE